MVWLLAIIKFVVVSKEENNFGGFSEDFVLLLLYQKFHLFPALYFLALFKSDSFLI